MKVKAFLYIGDYSGLDEFLERDGKDIKIRFITESDYVIRIYYDEQPRRYTVSVQGSDISPNEIWRNSYAPVVVGDPYAPIPQPSSVCCFSTQDRRRD
jgi:hypothetical protein